MSDPIRLSIAVLTFRRPDAIDALLPLLIEQAAAAPPGVCAEIVVVDNDPAASASRNVAQAAASAGALPPIRYVHEPEPGISAARNRALQEGRASDLLVFIDDDERPVAGWLAHLLTTYRAHRPAAVVGPVVSEFEVTPERWVSEGGFFARRRMPTGTAVTMAGAGNLLLDLHQIRRFGLTFDVSLGTSGGEDTLFTSQIARNGGTMLWCDEAIARDLVPAARLRRRWLLLRSLSHGNSLSTTSLRLQRPGLPVPLTRLLLTCQGMGRMAVGGVRCAVGLAMGSARHQARGARLAARGLGMSLGAWGFEYQEYRRKSS